MRSQIEKECRQKAKELGLKIRLDKAGSITLVEPSGQKNFCSNWESVYKFVTNVDPLDIEPSHFRCVEMIDPTASKLGCGWTGNNPKTIKILNMKFGGCPKCGGKIAESEDWVNWLNRQRDKQRQRAIEKNNGYMFGVDICTPEERAILESK